MNPRKHNRILKTITTIAFLGLIFSGMTLDSDTIIPVFVALVCLSWLVVFGIANTK
ncbi:MAG: hypothetical protein J6S67_04190 [Methanobrevibacter sp.]|nr:hypothetical protein [Methanobrevibacter sp.]